MSLRKAINEKCKDCIHDPKAPGSWLKQVGMCIATPCPLHPYRPGRDYGKDKGNKGEIPEGLRKYQESRKKEQ